MGTQNTTQALAPQQKTETQLYFDRVAQQEVTTALATAAKMVPLAYTNAVFTTCFPKDKPNVGQFLAFLTVAQQYHLNPLLKQLYAFPTQDGGLVPMVPVDGWIQLIQQNPRYNGVKFAYFWDDGSEREVPKDKTAKLVAIKALIAVKGQSEPTEITEFMAECQMLNKTPWKTHPTRMLRHKALIQCARVALGLSGIYDEDEADRILENGNGGGGRTPVSTPQRVAPAQTVEAHVDEVKTVTESTPAEVTAAHTEPTVVHETAPETHAEPETVTESKTETQEMGEGGAEQAPAAETEQTLAQARAVSPFGQPAATAAATTSTGAAAVVPDPGGKHISSARVARLFAIASAARHAGEDMSEDQVKQIVAKEFHIADVKLIPNNKKIYDDICKRVGGKLALKS